MDRRFSAALAVMVIALAGCNQPVNTHVDWPPGADWDDYGAQHCPAQCQQLERLVCPESKPTAGGIECPESCVLLVQRRIWSPADIACVEQAGSVEAVRKCRVRCRQ